ncbi:MAG: 4Fe-4S binding protein [Candidatus Omnitrophica bacterium]|nr:4Fe-4S binding protein [Candidatus Omnitrophota bacterium]HOX54528.1 4Fe-4S binding protein [Candidatus Omnitrophota bacterium]
MKRLFIDLDKCNQCPECVVACSYMYHPQPFVEKGAGPERKSNMGITSLREYATFALFCRHCEEAPCVNSCYHDALERQSDGHLKRYKMRCTSCKSCAVACPFGTIFPDFIPYLDSRCDYCLGRVESESPVCLASCPYKAVEVKEVKEEPENNIYLVGEHLAVKSRKWSREDIQFKKK